MLLKISEVIGKKLITSKKNGKSYEIFSYRDTQDNVFESFDKLEPGKEYDGDMTSNQYGNSFKLQKGMKSMAAPQANLRVEALLAASNVVSKTSPSSLAEASKSTIQISEIFLTWLQGEVVVAPAPAPQPEVRREDDIDINLIDF